jgi:hypothetical protein
MDPHSLSKNMMKRQFRALLKIEPRSFRPVTTQYTELPTSIYWRIEIACFQYFSFPSLI